MNHLYAVRTTHQKTGERQVVLVTVPAGQSYEHAIAAAQARADIHVFAGSASQVCNTYDTVYRVIK